MEFKMFYKTQRELADAINMLVDSYWDDKLEENVLIERIQNLNINMRRSILFKLFLLRTVYIY